MSNKTLLTAIVVALGLGLVTLLVLRKPGGGGAGAAESGLIEAGARVLEVDASRVMAVVVAPSGTPGAGTRVERDAQGQWRLRSSGAAQGPAWRVDGERVRNLLKILGTVVTVARPAPGAKVGDGATVVTLELDGAGAAPGQGNIVLRLSPQVLGGQGLIEVTSPAANVPAGPGAGTSAAPAAAGTAGPVTRLGVVASSLHALFQGEGVRAWRDTALLPGVMAEASRVRLVRGDRSLALARVQGAWGLTEPVASPADPGAVQRLLTALEGARIARFMDELAPGARAQTGLDAPAARVVIESDVREVSGAADQATVRTVTRELVIGEALDATGKQRYASLDGGATVVAVEAASLAEIKVDAGAYLSRVATTAAGADIGLIMLEGAPAAPGAGGVAPATVGPVNMGFQRGLEGWYELRPDGTRIMADPGRAAGIAELTKFLTTEPAAEVFVGEPTGYQAIGRLTLRTAGDSPLDEVEVGRHAGAGVALKSGRVTRTYARTPELLKVVLGPIEPLPGEPGGGSGPARDINK